MLLFDNKGHSKRSRIWEIDPVTDALKWRYGDAPSEEIYSSCCGTAQRLSNGNTLITETDAGRALEVDRDGTVVWEYVTSLRSLADPELVARVFEVERLSPDFGADWLSPNPGHGNEQAPEENHARPRRIERCGNDRGDEQQDGEDLPGGRDDLRA